MLDTSHAYTFSDAYLGMRRAYFAKHQRDHWWLPTSDVTEEQIPAMVERLYGVRDRVTGLLADYRDTNSATQHIADRFPRLQASVFVQGASRQLFREHDFVAAVTGEGFEICFVPENEQDDPSLVPNCAWYRAEWHAVMLYAVDVPDDVLAGLLYHELFHAVTHHDGATSATAQFISDDFVAEEVYAHDRIETAVLDRATHGAFAKLVAKVVGRKTGKEQHLAELLELIRQEDLAMLDTMLQIEQSGPLVTGAVFAQFEIAILFAYADSTKTPVEEKLRSYRWLTQHKQ